MKRLKKYEREIEFCSYCPKLCRFSCPVAKVTCSEASTPTGKMTILKLIKDGAFEFTPEAAELMYQCSGCLLSRAYCEHVIEVIGAFEAARAIAVEKGIAPKRVMEFGAAFTKAGNPYAKNFGAELRDLTSGRHLQKAPMLLFTGCTMAHYFPETIKHAAKVLERLGVDFEILAEDGLCCGYPMFATGHEKILEEHKTRLAKKLAGHETIVSLCPTCVWFLKTHYQKPGLISAGAISHATEFLSTRLGALKLKSKVEGKIVYHDPCHLGRYLGIYDPPREILNQISANGFTEFHESRERSECCGGGGGLPIAHPGIARGIGMHKIRQFQQLGGELLATACPMCERMLERSGKEAGGVKVRDLISLIAENID